jgi:hypothetical protein
MSTVRQAQTPEIDMSHPHPAHRDESAPWVAYVPMPDSAFLEVAGSAELGRLPGKLALAVACRDARRERAA